MVRYAKHVITHEDTVQSIAQKYANDVNFWQAIVAYNNLTYPYIVETVQEKMERPESLVTLGDTIIIPIEQNLLDIDTHTLQRRDEELILSLALGKDLKMTTEDETNVQDYGNYDSIFQLDSDNRGDLALVQGVENLKQAIIARLLTPKGSLLLHPDYGTNLHMMVGERGTINQMVRITDEITSTIFKDGRVEDVIVEETSIDEDVYFGRFTVELSAIEDYFELVISQDGTQLEIW